VCDVCKKTYVWKHNLQSHQLTHTGHRPYACDVCNKTFSRKYALQIHQITHTG
jgi:KRAB domain-containing zinc finger protein